VEPGSVVVVSCNGPREKFWGVLLAITPAGVTLRGIPLAAFEDFLHQEVRGEPQLIAASTMFLPLHRVERLELDEPAGAVEGLAARFRRVTGREPAAELLGEAGGGTAGELREPR